jgi:hypothetical protein
MFKSVYVWATLMDLLDHDQTVIPIAGELIETERITLKTVKSALNFLIRNDDSHQ